MSSRIGHCAVNLFVAAIAASTAAGTANAATSLSIYVSPNGNDAGSGEQGSPFKSLPAAQAAARRHLAAMAAGSEARQSVKVEIEAGVYQLAAPLQLTDADSGAANSPMVYEAVTPGTVVISGGTALPLASDSTKQAIFKPPSGAVDWAAAQQLYVDDHRATLARQPKAGTEWFVTKGGAHPSAAAGKTDASTFGASPEALAFLATLSADDRARAVVDVYQSWTTGRHRLAADAPPGEVRISPPAKWPFLVSGTSQRWFVENVRAALDAPGEWFGDASGVTYLKQPGDSGPTSAVLPLLDTLVTVKGQAAGQKWVQYLELRGLAFEHTRLLTPTTGLLDIQAAAQVGAAVEVDAARNVTITDCRLSHLGGYGIWMRGNVRDSVVSGNTLTDLGAGGIRVGLPQQSASDQAATGNVRVSDNTISDTGQIMPGAVGIWVGQSFDNTITKNLVSNTTYTGISVGWAWGYAAATAGRNAITNNVLYNIGMGQMSDLGGIYLLGIQPGTVVSGNLIREVRGYPGYGPSRGAGAWGIYEDEGVSQVVAENNVIIGTDSGAFHLHYGRDDVVRNNLFALGKDAELRVSNSDPSTHLATSNNLFIAANNQPFDVKAGAADAQFSGNAVSSTSSGASPDVSKCGAGCSRSSAKVSTTSDPKGVTVSGASPDMMSMVNATIANAGPSSAPAARTMRASAAPAIKAPTALSIKLAAPAGLTLDIAGTPLGQLPAALQYTPGVDPAEIQLVERTGAQGGGKCVQLTDNPANKNRWEPFAFSQFEFASGTTEVTFQLWVDSASEFIQEWRDASSPYKVGPSFTISARGVENHGKVVLPVTLNAWNTFHVTAKLGAGAGRWSLAVQDAQGGIKATSDQPNGSPDFKELKWLGFISNATVKTTSCIGSLQVTNHG